MSTVSWLKYGLVLFLLLLIAAPGDPPPESTGAPLRPRRAWLISCSETVEAF